MNNLSRENRAELVTRLHNHLQQNSTMIKNSLKSGIQKIARRGCFISENMSPRQILFEIENYRGTVVKKERGTDGLMVVDRILTTPYPVDYGYEFVSEETVECRGLIEYEDVIRICISSEFSGQIPSEIRSQRLLQNGLVIGLITMLDTGQQDNKWIIINSSRAYTQLSVADLFAVELQISNYLEFCKYYKITSDLKLKQIFSGQTDDSSKINQFIKILSLELF
jgi:inorganic pyrophosphatase